MLSYNEQINHPHWQRKRLEIMRRDKWECRVCGESNKQFHVHHLYYEKDCHIWDYDNEALVTICKDCHKEIHTDLKKLSGIIAFEILSGKIDVVDFKNHLLNIS